MLRNLRVTQALRGKLSGQHDLSRGLHVHRRLWTVGYLRQHCGPKWTGRQPALAQSEGSWVCAGIPGVSGVETAQKWRGV